MRKLLLLIPLLFILAFQSSPYARRIRPFTSTPSSCQENEIGYNMTSHSLVVCTNSGYVTLATGGSGGTAAPTDATYITRTANTSLSAEFALGSLATGILKNTTTTGTPSIAIAGTDYENPLTFNSPLSRSTNTISCSTCGLTSNPLSQFASTTSSQLAGVLSDESGATGVFILGNFTSLTANDVLTWNGTNWINAVASGGGGSIGTGNINMTIVNDGSTGTTVNRLAKLAGAPSTAIVAATNDTENAVGICTANCGTTGDATIAIVGQVDCEFDGATTAGNYVIISSITAGKCHDGGSAFPTSGAAYGKVLTTNGGAGTYAMTLMTPDIAFQNAGNGKSKPGGSANQLQYNGTGTTFAGTSGLTWDDTNKKLTWAQGTSTTNQPWLTLTNTWNNNTITFQGLVMNLTDTSSAVGSKLIDVQVGGTSQITIQRVSNPQYALTIPNGSNSRPGLSFTSNTTTGISGGSNIEFNVGGSVIFRVNSGNLDITASSGIQQNSGGPYRWQSSTRILSPSNASLRIDGNSDDTHPISVILGNDSNANGIRLKQDGGSSAAGIFVRNSNDTNNRFLVDAGRLFVSTQFDKTNTTLANVTELVSETLTAGKTYSFEANLFVDADVTGGSKYAIAGTATATTIKYHVDMICDATNLFVINSRQTALAGSVGQAGCTAGLTKISGTITVNAAGTLAVQFAQNTANGTSSVLTMSKFEVRQLN